jgi:hypothetical protein
MQKEANFDVLFGFADGFAKETRKDHEMVILYPDQVAIFNDGGNLLGEFEICFTISIPRALVKVDLPRVVVEERPTSAQSN